MFQTVIRKIAILLLMLFLLAAGAVASAENPFEDSLRDRSETLVNYQEEFKNEVEKIIANYHQKLNEELNKRIDILLNSESIEPLKDLEKCKEKKDAVETYCVAEVFINEYFALRGILVKKRNDFTLRAQEGKKKDKTPQEVAENIKGFDMLVDRELAVAQKTMELSLSAYNELHLAYPLHKKYEELIKALEKYRNRIRDIRDEIELFPTTFFNVSTPNCT